MELGNLCFGNSRGSFPLPRHSGWEDEFLCLVRRYQKSDKNWGYPSAFENNTFKVFPYYWGDCTCGYDKAEWGWCEANKHDEGCYQYDYRACVEKGWKTNYKKLKVIYKKHGMPTEGEDWHHGCAVRCTCTYDDRWAKFCKENEHSKDCPLVQPNFLYKPTGFEIQWYKYPFRDSYMNQEITLGDFMGIVDDCIKSLQ